MKRGIICVLCAIFALCFSITVFAEETAKTVVIPFGDGGTVALKLVESFDNAEDSPSEYGTCTIENGEILLEGMASCVDRYGIKTPELKAAGKLEGAKYIVFSIENGSDGDIWFCFQPEVAGYGNVFLGGEIEGGRFILVDKEGNMTVETEADGSPETNNGRYGYTVPEAFQGYVFIPKELVCQHQQWDKPLFGEGKDPKFEAVGFNVYSDEAAVFELRIFDMFTAEELPEYVPKPTPEPTNTPEPTPTKAPANETAKNQANETGADTGKTDDPQKKDKEGKGCGGFIAGTAGTTGTAAWCVVFLAAACAILIAKRREK